MTHTQLIFTKLAPGQRLFVKNSCNEFYEYPTTRLVVGSKSETD